MKHIAILALACASTTALADITAITNYAHTTLPSGGYENRDASGTFGARMAVFSTAGGAFYDDSTGGAGANNQNFGVNESMGLFGTRDIRIVSSQTLLTNGNQLISFDCFTADGLPFVAVGQTLAGATINAIQFDIGTPNAPSNPVDFDTNITIISAIFTVSNASSTFGPFASTAAVVGGNGMTLRSGVSAGTDITTFQLNRFHVEAEVQKTIPTPGAMALLGLGGLVVGRRRR